MCSFSPHNTDYFLTSSNAQARYYYYYYYYSFSSSFCPGLPLAFNRLLLLLLRVGVEDSKKIRRFSRFCRILAVCVFSFMFAIQRAL
jgi:hypothetical protein